MRVSPAEANAHADTDSVLPVPASAVSEGVAPKPDTQRRSRGGRTVVEEVQDALEPLGSLRYTDTSRRAAAGRAELLANLAALVVWSGVGCNLSAVTAGS